MSGIVARALRALTRPLWTEDPLLAARRRIRLMFGVPFATIAGLAWGVYTAPVMAEGSVYFWGAFGAASMALLTRIEYVLLTPLQRLLGRTRFGGPGAVFLAESAMVGAFVLAVIVVVGNPFLPGVRLALAFGAAYTATVEFLFFAGAERLGWLLSGGGAWGGARPRSTIDHSVADTMAHRGELEEASALYRSAIRSRPREASAYVRLFRLRVQSRDFEGAVDVLEDCFRAADLSSHQAGFIVRQMHEISERRLRDRARAADCIALLLDREPDGTYAEWARNALAEIDAGPSADESPSIEAPEWHAIDGLALELDTERRLEVDAEFRVPAEYLSDGFCIVERNSLFDDLDDGPVPPMPLEGDSDLRDDDRHVSGKD